MGLLLRAIAVAWGRAARRKAWAGVVLLAGALSIASAAPASPNPHEPCATCHVTETDPALVEPEPALCLRCHPSRDRGSEHPIGISPGAGAAPALPMRAGRMTCITCHHEHATGGSMMLRLPLWDLCSACHRY